MAMAALASKGTDEELRESQYRVLELWQKSYGGSLLIMLPDTFGTTQFLVGGHNPNLTLFLGSLLVPAAATAPASIRLRKGSLARLNLTRGPALLQGLLDPRTVRALYATSTSNSRRKTSRK